MGAVYTEAQKKASNKYYASTDEIRVRCPKGKKQAVKEKAESLGMTLGEFVNKVLDEAIRVNG